MKRSEDDEGDDECGDSTGAHVLRSVEASPEETNQRTENGERDDDSSDGKDVDDRELLEQRHERVVERARKNDDAQSCIPRPLVLPAGREDRDEYGGAEAEHEHSPDAEARSREPAGECDGRQHGGGGKGRDDERR